MRKILEMMVEEFDNTHSKEEFMSKFNNKNDSPVAMTVEELYDVMKAIYNNTYFSIR